MREFTTQLQKMVNEPLLHKVLMKAMCKDPGRLAEGYKVKGTETIHFMFLEEIMKIPKYRAVMYAWTVVDYRDQKEYPTSVQIMVKGTQLITHMTSLRIHMSHIYALT